MGADTDKGPVPKGAGCGKLTLDLRRHCIETAIRKGYNRVLTDLLRSRGSAAPEAEFRLALLKTTLEELDFPALRDRYRELAGHCNAEVVIGEDGSGGIGIWIDGRAIKG